MRSPLGFDRDALYQSWTLLFLFACCALPSLALGSKQPRLIRPPLGPDATSSQHVPLSQPSLGNLARHAVTDVIERRSPQREPSKSTKAAHDAADTVLLAVSGRGTYSRVKDEHNAAKTAHQDAATHGHKAAQVAHENSAAALSVLAKTLAGDPEAMHMVAVLQQKAAAIALLQRSDIPGVAASGKNATQVAVGGKNATGGGNTTGDGGIMMAVTAEQLIYVYYCIVPVVIIACIFFECVHKRWAGIDLSEPITDFNRDSAAGQGMRMSNWTSGFWPLTRQFFIESEMAGTAKLLLGMLLFLAFWTLFMDWARNIWQRDFWDAIEAKHVNRFWKAMSLFMLMAVVSVLCNTYQGYAQTILTIRWRATLTRNLQEKWLIRRAFCVGHFPATTDADGVVLDNPDQRLQEDVAGFIDGGLSVFFGVFMSFGRLALFVPILFMLSPNYAFGYFYCPGWLLYVSVIYSGIGSAFTHMAGQWLVPLSFLRQQVEADYRHTAVQVRDHTESIAMYGSEETEHNRLTGRFDRIQRVVWEQMKYNKQLGFFRNFYFLLNDIAPFCILAGNYFQGQITLGQMMQILGALGHVSDSLNAFVQAYTDIADLRATTDRLYGFFTAVEKGAKFVEEQTMSKEVSPPGDTAALYAQEVSVRFPAQEHMGERIMWDKAGLVVQPGERVLLLGPDGCGKSVFLRALAGCWPANGSVRIGRGALFVPQRPFVPAGQLREALAYPEPFSCYSDEEMTLAISSVKLTALYEVPLSEEADWCKRLSGGELQRLALAHAVLRKPGLLVLDETTAAIGEDQTAELYGVLAKLLPRSTAVISVDHDAISQVGNWHNVHYTLDVATRKWVPANPARDVN